MLSYLPGPEFVANRRFVVDFFGQLGLQNLYCLNRPIRKVFMWFWITIGLGIAVTTFECFKLV